MLCVTPDNRESPQHGNSRHGAEELRKHPKRPAGTPERDGKCRARREPGALGRGAPRFPASGSGPALSGPCSRSEQQPRRTASPSSPNGVCERWSEGLGEAAGHQPPPRHRRNAALSPGGGTSDHLRAWDHLHTWTPALAAPAGETPDVNRQLSHTSSCPQDLS